MYRRYVSTGTMGTGAMASTNKSLILLTSTAAIRPYIYDFTFGTIGTPSDSVVTLTLLRYNATAATLGTAFTPLQLDTSDAANAVTGVVALTSEGTGVGTTVLFKVGLNVRATYRWVAAPGGELIMAASTTTAGSISVGALSPAYVLDAQATTYHAE